jgi:hypothetical protein
VPLALLAAVTTAGCSAGGPRTAAAGHSSAAGAPAAPPPSATPAVRNAHAGALGTTSIKTAQIEAVEVDFVYGAGLGGPGGRLSAREPHPHPPSTKETS